MPRRSSRTFPRRTTSSGIRTNASSTTPCASMAPLRAARASTPAIRAVSTPRSSSGFSTSSARKVRTFSKSCSVPFSAAVPAAFEPDRGLGPSGGSTDATPTSPPEYRLWKRRRARPRRLSPKAPVRKKRKEKFGSKYPPESKAAAKSVCGGWVSPAVTAAAMEI